MIRQQRILCFSSPPPAFLLSALIVLPTSKSRSQCPFQLALPIPFTPAKGGEKRVTWGASVARALLIFGGREKPRHQKLSCLIFPVSPFVFDCLSSPSLQTQALRGFGQGNGGSYHHNHPITTQPSKPSCTAITLSSAAG